METTTVKIDGMTCMGCVGSVQRVLTALDGVSHAAVSLQPGQAEVTFDPAKTGPAAIRAAITEAGYEAA